MTGPDGSPFCPGKVHENTPSTLIIGQFLTRIRGQVNRRAILIRQNRTKNHIASTWFRQFDLPKVHTNRRFFKHNPFNATLPEINCISPLAFPPLTSPSYRNVPSERVALTMIKYIATAPLSFSKARNRCGQSLETNESISQGADLPRNTLKVLSELGFKC